MYSICFVILCASFLGLVAARNPAVPVCPKPSLKESLLPVVDQCPSFTGIAPQRVWSDAASIVVVSNEADLEQVLKMIRNNNESFAAMLYYASWCQFSNQLRSVFESLATVFPSILHVEVEESSIRPGLLSKYGVYSFPVLYIHTGASKSRYSGPRTMKNLVNFYVNITGIQPRKMKMQEVKPLPAETGLSERLQNDTYLVLACWFLILRVLFMVLPVAVNRMKNFWNKLHIYKMMLKPRGQNDVQGVADRSSKNNRRRLSVPGWSHQITSPSSSLAIAESRARRIAPPEDLMRYTG